MAEKHEAERLGQGYLWHSRGRGSGTMTREEGHRSGELSLLPRGLCAAFGALGPAEMGSPMPGLASRACALQAPATAVLGLHSPPVLGLSHQGSRTAGAPYLAALKPQAVRERGRRPVPGSHQA